MNLIKSGDGKAYHHAREKHGHQREIHAERRRNGGESARSRSCKGVNLDVTSWRRREAYEMEDEAVNSAEAEDDIDVHAGRLAAVSAVEVPESAKQAVRRYGRIRRIFSAAAFSRKAGRGGRSASCLLLQCQDDVPFDADDAVPFVTEDLWESTADLRSAESDAGGFAESDDYGTSGTLFVKKDEDAGRDGSRPGRAVSHRRGRQGR